MFASAEEKFAKLMFQFDTKSRRSLWLKLSKLLGNGVPILQSLQSIYGTRLQTGGKSHPQTFALKEWISGVENGKRLSEMIVGWVGTEERMLIAAGESSGKPEDSLESAARVLSAKSQIKGAVLSGILYPAVLVSAAFGVLYVFGFMIVPAFLRIASVEKWSGLARKMIEVSLFAQHWLWLIALLLITIFIVFIYSLPRWDGQLRIMLDRYAPFSIYRVMNGSTWLIALAALVEAGLRVEIALQQLAATASPWMKTRILACLSGIRSGHDMGAALSKSGYEFPDREIITDLGVYSQLGGFDEALSILGNEWLKESVAQIKARMQVVFGISILIVGSLIAFMAGGMMNMMLQMGQLVKNGLH
ncbi:type II secretion system protein (plasmid) [Methylovorus glucosotrophus SIP3-4]|uniref:Type II secretion system protein n=2 Tax=Methylovorus glucosotrophus TaxID=266009 RepID=C6XET3_METGS|nr:type II secretion system protein [Methylovorus glucosotrophus SIP3-4]